MGQAAARRGPRNRFAVMFGVLGLSVVAALASGHAAADEGCLASGCHEDVARAPLAHGPVREGKCSPCHRQAVPEHPGAAGPEFRMVHGGGKDLCYSCHLDFGAGVGNSIFFHRPVEQGDCEGCHEPHGSRNGRLLRRALPTELNLPFRVVSYSLCWSCHNQAMVSLESTNKITNFRNGEQNLHVTHVNRRPTGCSCRACHLVHGSRAPRLVRQWSGFSDAWAPIRGYSLLPNGGRCDASCHGPRSYDRVQPVEP